MLFGCVYYSDWGYNLLRFGTWGVNQPMNDTCGKDDTCASADSLTGSVSPARLLVCNAVEALFVFLPYVVLRPFFPTTRLGEVLS